jgi:hypothetical protein
MSIRRLAKKIQSEYLDIYTTGIRACTKDGRFCRTVLKSYAYYSNGHFGNLALHPRRGLMFWTVDASSNRIEQASMNGEGLQTIVSASDGSSLVAIDIDSVKEHLYLAHVRLDRLSIERIDIATHEQLSPYL